jgi:diguanylate cyclase (GGDEF)-like protein/PAS domain S-box-containing protein
LRVGVIYFCLWVATWYSAGLLDRLGGVSLWFLPAGLRFACVLMLGWMGVLLELVTILIMTLVRTLAAGEALPAVLSIEMLWTLFGWVAPVFGYAVVLLPLRRWIGSKWDFTRATHSALFIGAGLGSALLAAMIGTIRQSHRADMNAEQLNGFLAGWTIGDFVGIVTLAPLLIVMVWPRVARYLRGEPTPEPVDSGDWAESSWALPVVISTAALLLVFAVPWYLRLGLDFPLLAVMLLLPLGAIALWFGLQASLLAALVLDTGLVVLIALTHQGALALQYQLVMIAIALVGLWLGAAVQARNRMVTRYRDFARNSSDLLWEINTEGELTEFSGKLANLIPGAINQPWQNLLAPCEQPNLPALVQAMLQRQTVHQLEAVFRGADQLDRWMQLSGQPVYGDAGEWLGFRGTAVDVSKERQADALMRNYNQDLLAQVAQRTRELSLTNAELAIKEKHLRLLLTAAPVGVIELDPQDCCTYLNANGCALTGYNGQQAIGMAVFDFVHPQDRSRVILAWRASRLSRELHGLEFRLARTQVWCSAAWIRLDPAQDAGLGAILVLTDSTARHQYEEKLWALAHHDPMTKLPNRNLFNDRCAQALHAARRRDSGVALLWIDLDGFKGVNDELGHEAGDALLGQVAQRLRSRTRESDTLARMGGDEFAVLLPDITDVDQAVALANELVIQLTQPFDLLQGTARISGSVGVALYPQDADGVDTLTHCADLAMYCAKRKGGAQVRVWGRDCSEFSTIPADL